MNAFKHHASVDNVRTNPGSSSPVLGVAVGVAITESAFKNHAGNASYASCVLLTGVTELLTHEKLQCYPIIIEKFALIHL